MTLEKSEDQASSESTWNWFGIPLTVWLTLTGAYFIYAIHLAGRFFHETYLGLFGIDANLFPRSLEEIAALGQVVLLERFTRIFMVLVDALSAQGWWIWGGVSLYFFGIFLALRHFPKGAAESKRLPQLPLWVKDAGKGVFFTSTLLLGAVYFCACWLLVSWLPVPLGQGVGADRYKQDLALFKQGCKAATQHQQCIQLLKSDQTPLAEGFLIDSSSSHVALYDVQLNLVRALERTGTELRVIPSLQATER